MPEMRCYTVSQEREVKVTAKSAIDAARLACAAFSDLTSNDQSIKDVAGHLTSPIRVRDIHSREDY